MSRQPMLLALERRPGAGPGEPLALPLAAAATPSAEPPPPRLRRVDRTPWVRRPVDVGRLIGEEHPARAIWEFVGRLNLGPFHRDIQAVEGVAGRSALDPQLLISLWVYACSEGVSSAREIARLCADDPASQGLTGRAVITPHALSDFRVDHNAARADVFRATLGLRSAAGLITRQRVRHAGTKGKACAGADTFRREETIRAPRELARQQVEQRGDPRSEEWSQRVAQARARAVRERKERLQVALAEQAKLRAAKNGEAAKQQVRGSESDPDTRSMQQADGGFAPSSNGPVSSDTAAGRGVGADGTQAGSDDQPLGPALTQVEENLGRVPAPGVADGGFTSRENILAMDDKSVDCIGSLGDGAAQSAGQRERRGVEAALRPAACRSDPASDTYTCPAGQRLLREGKEERIGGTPDRDRTKAGEGPAGPVRAQGCPQSGSKGRTRGRAEESPPGAAFQATRPTDTARQSDRQRGRWVACPNAWIKAKIRLRQCRLRGLRKVRREALWACLTSTHSTVDPAAGDGPGDTRRRGPRREAKASQPAARPTIGRQPSGAPHTPAPPCPGAAQQAPTAVQLLIGQIEFFHTF